jgi:hypothetical protein
VKSLFRPFSAVSWRRRSLFHPATGWPCGPAVQLDRIGAGIAGYGVGWHTGLARNLVDLLTLNILRRFGLSTEHSWPRPVRAWGFRHPTRWPATGTGPLEPSPDNAPRGPRYRPKPGLRRQPSRAPMVTGQHELLRVRLSIRHLTGVDTRRSGLPAPCQLTSRPRTPVATWWTAFRSVARSDW